jgi:glycosyltransferase involved in cell wall biosynthesis
MSGGSAGDYELVSSSSLFDEPWYSGQYRDVEIAGIEPAHHYLHYGHLMGRSPSPFFDGRKYLDQNDDVAKAGLNPLLHYLKYGSIEGRPIFPANLRTDQWPRDPAALLDSPYVFEANDLPNELREEFRHGIDDVRISVVMPTWNRRGVIVRALNSAFRQSLAPSEVIVIDDGSVDGTLEMLESEFADEVANGRLILIGCMRGGVSRARNRGLETAAGDFIAYLDSDNEWHSDHLLYSVGMLHRSSEFDCAYTAIRISRAGEGKRRILSNHYCRDRLLRSNFIDLNAFVHRREKYLCLGGFDQTLRRLVDWDLIIRYTADKRPLRVPVITVEYYLDADKLRNITFTEHLDLARDAIHVKHRDEYVARRILNVDQIDQARGQLIAARAEAAAVTIEDSALTTFNVVLPEEGLRSALPDLADLDVFTTVLVQAGKQFRVASSSAPGMAVGSVLDALPVGVYWCPDTAQPLPHVEQLRALYLTLATEDFDFAVISYSLIVGADVVATCLRNQVVVSHAMVRDWLSADKPLRLGDRRGKILRIPPAPATETHHVAISTLLGEDVVAEERNLVLYEKFAGLAVLRGRATLPALVHLGHKPTVLVLPMKVAVGGVERNTVEIMRALRDRYDFIYLTMEKIYQEQGSLASQVMNAAHRFIDMAEISTHDHYIRLLRMFKTCYAPEVVWICNGSMWMCSNAQEVRKVFSDTPIVDQQVYDVNEGWIRRYMEPGIQSFDRFIAINSRIRNRFVDDFRMDPSKVDLIYSAIDSERFRQLKQELSPSGVLRSKYGLPDRRRTFAFMGRLVEQKRPMDFLEIAALRSAQHDEHYVLVGNGALASEVEAWLQSHADVSVQWIPYVENTAEFWSLVDAQVVTSAYEGLPIAMLEALSMGVPVISTDVGDIGTVLAEHRAGMVVGEAGDPKAFAMHMDRFVTELEVFRAHLQIESEYVLDRFSSRAIAEQYHESWQAAIRQRSARMEAAA